MIGVHQDLPLGRWDWRDQVQQWTEEADIDGFGVFKWGWCMDMHDVYNMYHRINVAKVLILSGSFRLHTCRWCIFHPCSPHFARGRESWSVSSPTKVIPRYSVGFSYPVVGRELRSYIGVPIFSICSLFNGEPSCYLEFPNRLIDGCNPVAT